MDETTVEERFREIYSSTSGSGKQWNYDLVLTPNYDDFIRTCRPGTVQWGMNFHCYSTARDTRTCER